MQNWTALLGLEQGVKVRHTSKSWIIHVPVIRGKNPAEVYGLAMNLSNRIAVALAKKYGVVFAEGSFCGGEMAVEDPIAKLFGRYFSVRAGVARLITVGARANLRISAKTLRLITCRCLRKSRVSTRKWIGLRLNLSG